MSKKTKKNSTIFVNIYATLMGLMLPFICILILLFYGIKIDNLHTKSFIVDGLYIKLDKKLIVKAKNIEFFSSKSKKNSIEEAFLLLNNAKYLRTFFELIDIKHLRFGKNEISIKYDKNLFFFDTNFLELMIKIFSRKDAIFAEILSLKLKDFDLEIKGDFSRYKKDKISRFKGKFKSYELSGDLNLALEKNLLFYKLNVNETSSINDFMSNFENLSNLHPLIAAWIYKKIHAKSYQIKRLEGKINIQTGDYFPHEIKALAQAKELEIYLNKNLQAIKIPHVNIILYKNTLEFDFIKGEYAKLEVDGSKVHIFNLFKEKTGISIDIVTNSPFNENIQQILRSFNIHIPVLQTSGKTKANLNLSIFFSPFKIDYEGDFTTGNANFLIANAPFYAKGANIHLRNNFIDFKDVNISFLDILKVHSSGIFDLKNLNYKGMAHDLFVDIKYKNQNILNLKKFNMPIEFSLKNGFASHIDELLTDINISLANNKIKINKLALIKEFSPIMKYLNLNDGSLNLQSKDFKNYQIDINATDLDPFLSKDGKALTSMDLKLLIDENISLSSPYFSLTQTHDKLDIKIDKSDILLKDMKVNFNAKDINKSIYLKANKSNIAFKTSNKKILSDDLEVFKSSDLTKLKLVYKKGSLNFTQQKNSMHFDIKNMLSSFLNALLEDQIFLDGDFHADFNGLDLENYAGTLHANNTFVKSFKTYNNILAFINSIPSLMAFKSPSFSQKGFYIKHANALLTRKNSTITLHSLAINGDDVDILGKGIIDLANNSISMDLKLRTLKNVSQILSYIPVVNYLLLGEDKSIQMGIKISGSLDDPKIETQALNHLVALPWTLIKRTFSLPFNLN